MTDVSRRHRQLDALRSLCREGGVARAVDLAFEHFAAFGRDEEIVELLAGALADAPPTDETCRRFAELRKGD